MRLSRVIDRRIRGFRIVDLAALAVVVSLALGVYAFKAFAGREGADIADVASEVSMERQRVRLLEARVAHLERPDRIERLARLYAGQAPVSARQEITPEGLAQVAARGAPP
ncbi:MAG TPA: cell division protein [Caulobacteraceae bacterium]|nr:cell division protein [Caulobacteraceae bacterium]